MPQLYKTWENDIVAGFIGAIVGISQAMGFVLIAGINPIYGLYTAIVATFVASFVTRSTSLTIGPTNALALIVASTLSTIDSHAQPEALFILTLLPV